MTKAKVGIGWFVGLMLLTCAVALPRVASAQSSCNGAITNNVVAGPQPAVVGDTVTIELDLGTFQITGGTTNTMSVNRLRFDLDCNADFALGSPCTDDGAVLSFEGNINTTGCTDSGGNPVAFNVNSVPGNVLPNELIFSPVDGSNNPDPVSLAANTDPSAGCRIRFDVTVQSYSNDSTQFQVENVAAYRTNTLDATCDNGLQSGSSQTSAVQLVPFTPTPTNTPTNTNTPTPTPTATPTNTPPPPTPTPTPTNTMGCGDGVVDRQAGETCDPPGSQDEGMNNPCRANCTFCGDGIVQPQFETCDDGNSNDNDACHNNCTRRLLNDPAIIRLHRGTQVNDRLQVHGDFAADHVVPTNTVGVRLRNSLTNAVIFEATVPFDALNMRQTKVRTFYRYDNPGAKVSGGVSLFKVAKDAKTYRVNAFAWGDMGGAIPQMTMEIFFNDEQYTSIGNWKRTLRGWYLWLK